MDYIRFPNEPPVIPTGSGIDYPRDAKTLALYNKDTGLTPEAAKAGLEEVLDNARSTIDEEWGHYAKTIVNAEDRRRFVEHRAQVVAGSEAHNAESTALCNSLGKFMDALGEDDVRADVA